MGAGSAAKLLWERSDKVQPCLAEEDIKRSARSKVRRAVKYRKTVFQEPNSIMMMRMTITIINITQPIIVIIVTMETTIATRTHAEARRR